MAPLPPLPEPPGILYANHHGWMDGYLMFHLVERMGLRCVDWIEEFDQFPLFRWVGGIRFAKGEPLARASAIRRTISLMRDGSQSLVIFPEGVLHRPPGVLPFGRAIDLVARKTGAWAMPVAIRYEMSVHERPEAFLSVGLAEPWLGLQEAQKKLEEQLSTLHQLQGEHDRFEQLVSGTRDVNERWGFAKK